MKPDVKEICNNIKQCQFSHQFLLCLGKISLYCNENEMFSLTCNQFIIFNRLINILSFSILFSSIVKNG